MQIFVNAAELLNPTMVLNSAVPADPYMLIVPLPHAFGPAALLRTLLKTTAPGIPSPCVQPAQPPAI